MNNQFKFDRAAQLARQAHGNQRYDGLPYEYHLEEVVKVLSSFGATLDEDDELAPVLVAAWLHDALEDTNLTAEEIGEEFGSHIRQIVERVTDESLAALPGSNRRERKARTYLKTVVMEEAVLLKLADRIANVEHSAETNRVLFNMYGSEHEDFSAALRPAWSSDLINRMWERLDAALNYSETAAK